MITGVTLYGSYSIGSKGWFSHPAVLTDSGGKQRVAIVLAHKALCESGCALTTTARLRWGGKGNKDVYFFCAFV